jgi:hypothetical protein
MINNNEILHKSHPITLKGRARHIIILLKAKF